ncbi:hypothetical protein ACTS9D_11580 [Empedobacter brevis]|uniref:hypothetical protein n=1 Tax=Empedobacter brevis TaxID=247 RepID=UPI002FE3114C
MPRLIKDENYFYQIIDKALYQYTKKNDFKELEIRFEDIDFEFKEPINLTSAGLNIYFKNCSFSESRIDITIDELEGQINSIEFNNCEIDSELFIKESKLKHLVFNDVIITSNNFYISSNEIYSLSIVGSSTNHNKINNLTLYDNSNIDFVDVRLNDFNFLYINNCNFIKGFTLNVNTINRLQIEKSSFQKDFEFWRNTLGDYSLIKKSTLGEVKAKESNFGIDTEFRDVIFTDRVEFIKLKSDIATLKFNNCTFQKNTYFDNSTTLNLEFQEVIFQSLASFQHTRILHLIKFKTTYFEKIGYFEGVKIGSLKSLDINTVRTIKGQLQKSESKIEYLKYNALEQRKHLQTLSIKDVDFYILKLNELSNDFGINWFKGVKFTIKTSIFFFIIIVLINSFTISDYPLKFNIHHNFVSSSIILSEFLKFSFSVGFGNEEIQSNGYLYLIFILSRICIGYGIYQTVTAFRKFGKI